MPDDPASAPQKGATGRTPTVPLRIPKVTWAAYGRVCDRLGTNRTADLLAHIDAQITAHGDETDLADLAAGKKELAERRERLHTGRPPQDRPPQE